MKKILFIIPTITQTNGVAAFIINYLSHMDLSNFEIEVIYDNLRPSKKYKEILNKLNIKTYQLPYIKEVGIIKYKKMVDNFFELHHDYDLVYSNISYRSIFFFKSARKNGINNIAIHAHATQSSDNKLKNLLGKLIQKKVNKMTDHKYACSKLAGKAMFNNDDFTVINNAIDYKKYKFNNIYRNEIRKKYKLTANDIVLGFIGRFVPQKNIYFFIELIQQMDKNYKMLMIGNGYLKNDFEKKVREEKLDDRFIFIEEIPNVNEYYSAFDYFLLPSLYEGLPVVGVEAQANGLPVLFSNTISDECKISSNTFYLDKENIGAWKECIKNTNRNQHLTLNDDFNIEIQSKRFENIIKNI